MQCAERPWLAPAIRKEVAGLPLAEVTSRCERANILLGAGRKARRSVRRRTPACHWWAFGCFHLTHRRHRGTQGRPADLAGRVWRRARAPNPTSPATALGRAQSGSSGRSRIFVGGGRRIGGAECNRRLLIGRSYRITPAGPWRYFSTMRMSGSTPRPGPAGTRTLPSLASIASPNGLASRLA
jgi:hypothetical protein